MFDAAHLWKSAFTQASPARTPAPAPAPTPAPGPSAAAAAAPGRAAQLMGGKMGALEPAASAQRLPGKLSGGPGALGGGPFIGVGVGAAGQMVALTPEQIKDRAAADQKLKKLFDIVPDGAKGSGPDDKPLPNQVDAKEYQRILGEYSDIELGKSYLKIQDTANEKQKAAVMDDIARLMQTAGGRSVLDSVTSGIYDHTVTIAPPDGKTGSPDPNDPRMEVNKADPTSNGYEPGKVQKGGEGGGLSAIVNYAPGQTVHLPGYEGCDFGTVRSDVALYHELLHSQHYISGTVEPGIDLDKGVDHGVANEEVAAAIAEDKYRKERNHIKVGAVQHTGDWRTDDSSMRGRPNYRAKEGPAMADQSPNAPAKKAPPPKPAPGRETSADHVAALDAWAEDPMVLFAGDGGGSNSAQGGGDGSGGSHGGG